ncbi:vWA domain-containing protein [Candidatus Parabeggiatoa sp. HSG14]|uniref:vWA domain-containing protein n=1 Tax=Candidatus Parabeggiatoa sp. HSG14 TaxID=3055593 RepID=UPI0025A92A9B|nr:vWA domain-containing protein [Thiotrichales bacterium HSG14]
MKRSGFPETLILHKAKVTANEYPAHLVRERTTIFIPEDIQVDLAFVIDVTDSMQEEMNSVINALTDFIGEIDTSTAPLMALLTFSDEVKVAAFTQDLTVLRGAIEDLTASGGGLCEEASIEALLVAIPHVKTSGDILFASDASPYPDANVDKVIELLRGKGIRFNAILTGDCTQKDSWNELPSNE